VGDDISGLHVEIELIIDISFKRYRSTDGLCYKYMTRDKDTKGTLICLDLVRYTTCIVLQVNLEFYSAMY
jgi:hypothetical protein